MTCRACGTEIAEKALICYRCGAPVAEPVYAPLPLTKSARLPVGYVLLGVLVVIALALALLAVF